MIRSVIGVLIGLKVKTGTNFAMQNLRRSLVNVALLEPLDISNRKGNYCVYNLVSLSILALSNFYISVKMCNFSCSKFIRCK